jgi:MoxR-like ATPase
MRVHLGYPAAAEERELLHGTDRRELVGTLSAVLNDASLGDLQRSVMSAHVSAALLDYVQALVAHTRNRLDVRQGLSPRAAIGLVRAARAWALIEGRGAVTPEHVQAVFAAVVEHRIRQDAATSGLAIRVLEAVPIP